MNYNRWAIHEAAFVLTKWPRDGLFPSHISPFSKEIKEDRPFFYLPNPSKRFDPKLMGSKFYKVFIEMKKSIEEGVLPAIFDIYLTELPIS